MIGVVRVAAAGVWQEEDPAARQSGLSKTQLEAVGGDHVREQHAEDRDTQQGDCLGPVSPDLPFQGGNSGPIFRRLEVLNADTGSGYDIRQAQLPFGQPPVFLIGQCLVDQARLEEKLPKTVRGSRKMMA